MTESEQGKVYSKVIARISRYYKEGLRVLKVTQKPSKEEFLTISKVAALGLVVIGMIGFILTMLEQAIIG